MTRIRYDTIILTCAQKLIGSSFVSRTLLKETENQTKKNELK